MGKTTKKKATTKAAAPKASKTVNFVDKVLSASKADNPEHLSLFQDRAVRHCDRAIQNLDDQLIDAVAAVEDAEKAVEEAVLNVELTSIKSVGQINDYIPYYLEQVEVANDKVTSKARNVENLKARKLFYSKVRKMLK